MANKYINLAYLYKRMPVLADTNGDHLIAASDLRTAIALAASETGEVHPMPCKIGSKIYEVTGEPVERIDIDEYTVSEVGLNGVFTSGGWPCYRSACGYKRTVLHNYCPNCGANMKGGAE